MVSLLYADFPYLQETVLLPEGFFSLLIPLGLSLLLAMTVYGVFFMPVCSFACGALISYLAQSVLAAGKNYSEYRDACAFLCVLVPAFFVVCSGGMYISSLVRESVSKAKPFIKTSFKSYIFAAAAAVAAVCLAGYIINKI